MDPKLLIWDWNGTIIDDADLCLEIENALLRERGMREITKEWYLAHFSFPIRAYYAEMGYRFQTESYETVSEIFMDRYRKRYSQCRLRAGVEDVLRKASERGVVQALLSVTRQDDLCIQVRAFGLDAYFSEILGQKDILGASKIDRAKDCMKRMKIDPRDALFIGDTDHDVEAANAVGCPCVLLTDGHQSREVLQRSGAPVFDSAEALGKELFH